MDTLTLRTPVARALRPSLPCKRHARKTPTCHYCLFEVLVDHLLRRRLSLKAVEGGLAEEEAYCSCLLHGYGEDRSYGRSIHACIVQLAKDVEHVAVQESMRRRRRS